MKTSGIYKIQSKLKPDRFYIGSAVNLDQRWNSHKYYLKINKHHSLKLQRHYNKYGVCDLDFIVLEPCLPYFLTIREQYYMDLYKPYFNICKIAGSPLGRKASNETIEKLRKASIGRNKGKVVSEETRKKSSESHKGQKPWCTGKKLTEEHRNKLRLAKLNKKRNPHTEETKEKMRIAANNKIPVLQFDKQGNFIKEWDSLMSVKCILSVSDNNIRLCINGKRKTAGGFIWERKVA